MLDPDPEALAHHVSRSYGTLRLGIGLIAVALPFVLVLGALAHGVNVQDSISAYYHAHLPSDDPRGHDLAGQGVMRDGFEGILWTLGVFLCLYRGYGRRENIALNVAGVLLVVVALVPMGWTAADGTGPFSLHGAAAILFFLFIAYVCIFRSSDTLPLIGDTALRERYRRWYRVNGVLMVVLPLSVFVLGWLIPRSARMAILLVECAGIWTFAAYWLVKTRELGKSDADLKALRGRLQPARRKPAMLAYLVDTTPLTELERPAGDHLPADAPLAAAP
ncbi:MAG: hypothetical protein U0229_02915 [Anaeromyxobacter sp.]